MGTRVTGGGPRGTPPGDPSGGPLRGTPPGDPPGGGPPGGVPKVRPPESWSSGHTPPTPLFYRLNPSIPIPSCESLRCFLLTLTLPETPPIQWPNFGTFREKNHSIPDLDGKFRIMGRLFDNFLGVFGVFGDFPGFGGSFFRKTPPLGGPPPGGTPPGGVPPLGGDPWIRTPWPGGGPSSGISGVRGAPIGTNPAGVG